MIGAENVHVDQGVEYCEPEHGKFDTTRAWLAEGQSTFIPSLRPGYKQVAPIGQFKSPPCGASVNFGVLPTSVARKPKTNHL